MMPLLSIKVAQSHVIKNHAPGAAELYILATVVDPTQEKPLVIAIKSFEGVKDNMDLPIGIGGLALYRNAPATVPPYVDIRLSIRKSNQPVRTLGEKLGAFLEKKETQDAIGDIRSRLIKNPAVDIAVEVGQQLLGLVMKGLELVNDRVILDYADAFEGMEVPTEIIRRYESDSANLTLVASLKEALLGGDRGFLETEPGSMDHTFRF